tara:strand:- start:455 stop:838 length:384 start_codon:yes stop_codon:yes gene_type:complete
MNPLQSISICFSKFATFRGRASRSEWWWFYLFGFVYQWVLDGIFDKFFIIDEGDYILFAFYLIFLFGIIIPTLAVAVRRFHDVGKSGWNHLWGLTIIGIIPVLIWLCRDGTKEVNRFGDPIDLNAFN